MIPNDKADRVSLSTLLVAILLLRLLVAGTSRRVMKTKRSPRLEIAAAATNGNGALQQLVKARSEAGVSGVDGVLGVAQQVGEAQLAPAGADHIIVESGGTFATPVLQLTDGQGVNVVYDGSGAVIFDDSLASLRRHGVLAYYGPVLGIPKPINIATLPRSVLIGFPTTEGRGSFENGGGGFGDLTGSAPPLL